MTDLAKPSQILFKNGRIIDPSQNTDRRSDFLITIENGRIAFAKFVNAELHKAKGAISLDCSGCLVTPGLIDMHTHVLARGTPLGVDVDDTCLRGGGVTTVVDAGSAGYRNIEELKAIADTALTTTVSFLHVAADGLRYAGCAGAGPNCEEKEVLEPPELNVNQVQKDRQQQQQQQQPQEPTQGECDNIDDVDVARTVQCIQRYPGFIKGIKVRLTEPVTNNGANEAEVYRRALRIRDATRLPLMVHHIISSIPTSHQSISKHADDENIAVNISASVDVVEQGTILDKEDRDKTKFDSEENIWNESSKHHYTDQLGCPSHLNTGDIYTHCFAGVRDNIVNVSPGVCLGTSKVAETAGKGPKPVVWQSVIDARQRGVWFDLGHGVGSFSWRVAEIAAVAGFWPDTISTDLHTDSCTEGPAYDLPMVMSKLLHLGMPLVDVIAAVTVRPARILGMSDIGTFKPGSVADITVLSLENKNISIEDSHGELRRVNKVLQARNVIKRGVLYNCKQPTRDNSTVGTNAHVKRLKHMQDELSANYGPGLPEN